MPKKQLRRAEVRKILSVYSGQTMLGTIEEGRNCIARDLDGKKIGMFENRRAAQAAFFARKESAIEAGTLMLEG
jgi:hypothetical protein